MRQTADKNRSGSKDSLKVLGVLVPERYQRNTAAIGTVARAALTEQ